MGAFKESEKERKVDKMIKVFSIQITIQLINFAFYKNVHVFLFFISTNSESVVLKLLRKHLNPIMLVSQKSNVNFK